MKQRLITSAIGIIIFFCVLPSPYAVFSTVVFILAVIGAFEINNAVTNNTILKIFGIFSAICIYIGSIFNYFVPCMFVVSGLYFILTVLLFGKEKVNNIYLLCICSIMFPVFFATISMIKRDFSIYEVLLPFIFSWITDSGAYFVGKAMGKHKLAEELSPKKTVEGSVGGIISCVIVAFLYEMALEHGFHYSIFENQAYLKIAVVSLIASVISQFGDLSLSAIKRENNIKDYGKLFPGHGGVLDRFDSVLFAAPFVFVILRLLN